MCRSDSEMASAGSFCQARRSIEPCLWRYYGRGRRHCQFEPDNLHCFGGPLMRVHDGHRVPTCRENFVDVPAGLHILLLPERKLLCVPFIGGYVIPFAVVRLYSAVGPVANIQIPVGVDSDVRRVVELVLPDAVARSSSPPRARARGRTPTRHWRIRKTTHGRPFLRSPFLFAPERQMSFESLARVVEAGGQMRH